MDVMIYTRNCSPLAGLEERIERAFQDALGEQAREMGRIEVFLERPIEEAGRRYILQINIRPYGTIGSERIDGRAPALLQQAILRIAGHAQAAVASRAAMAV